jgi:cell division protein FtsB
MSLVDSLRSRARPALVQVLAACLLLYFGYHLVQGDRGLFAWWRINGRLAHAEAELGKLHLERQTLGRRVALMRNEHIDEDMLDEQVRRMLDLVRPNEVVIYDR